MRRVVAYAAALRFAILCLHLSKIYAENTNIIGMVFTEYDFDLSRRLFCGKT